MREIPEAYKLQAAMKNVTLKLPDMEKANSSRTVLGLWFGETKNKLLIRYAGGPLYWALKIAEHPAGNTACPPLGTFEEMDFDDAVKKAEEFTTNPPRKSRQRNPNKGKAEVQPEAETSLVLPQRTLKQEIMEGVAYLIAEAEQRRKDELAATREELTGQATHLSQILVGAVERCDRLDGYVMQIMRQLSDVGNQADTMTPEAMAQKLWAIASKIVIEKKG